MLSKSEARSIAAQFKKYESRLDDATTERYQRVYGMYLRRNDRAS